MSSAKDLLVKPISSSDSKKLVQKYHYSKRWCPNSQLHLGVFLNGHAEGVMAFGPPMAKKNALPLVKDTRWNGMLELNRMAFSDRLPKNSESRALGVALRLIAKEYKHIEWIQSYADATQCGDGAIYRASGFLLVGIKKNTAMIRLSDGSVRCKLVFNHPNQIIKGTGAARPHMAYEVLPGFQLRYIYFINKLAKDRLTVPIIPFTKINELGAGMYKGVKRAESKDNVAPGFQPGEDGASPISALHRLGVAAGE